jgi:hypothetical protein
MVIDDKVVFIPIPKNASWSMEHTCVEYEFDLKYPSKIWENQLKSDYKNTEKHLHSTINDLLERFGTNFEYIAIIRDSTDRFISAWKYFVEAMVNSINSTLGEKIKNVGNEFIINFIKENHLEFCNAYNSLESRKSLLIKLVDKLGISKEYPIDGGFIERYTVHIFSFVSQYQWITNDKVIVKQFDFNNLKELEDYMSNKFNVDFKLIYKNKTNLDYCAVTRTPELVEFVDRYIDGVVKRSKSII